MLADGQTDTWTVIKPLHMLARDNFMYSEGSARFSQKVVSGKKPPTSENLAAHLEIVPLTAKNLVAKIATKFSGRKDKSY